MKSLFIPKKQLGQHFLMDPYITGKIISACQLKPDDIVLEIGPGLGVLTRKIASQVKQVIAIETDRSLCEELKRETVNSNIGVIHADFLKYDIEQLQNVILRNDFCDEGSLINRDSSPYGLRMTRVKKLKVIGNLPYYISSPIITKLLDHRQYFSSIFITVQLEFGERLRARIHTKDYGALSCFVQYFAEVKMLFKIKNSAFKPVPKVDSCFMRIIPQVNLPFKADDETLFFKIIRQAFQQRRKNLPNTLSGLIERERLYPILESLKIDPKSRPENLSVKDFVGLSNAVGKI